jgi:hypothetical protein
MSTQPSQLAGPPTASPWWFGVRPAALVLLAAFSFVYAPVVGHGFIKDDFGWIASSRAPSMHYLLALLTTAPTGFFRPMVSLSFSASYVVCGVSPFCYGLSNMLLALGCAGGIFALARALDLPRGGALAASAIWAFNWHGINMSVQWISGRTALVLVLFASGAAAAFLKGRHWLAAALCLGAMFSKEEGVLLPAILVAAAIAASWYGEGRRPESSPSPSGPDCPPVPREPWPQPRAPSPQPLGTLIRFIVGAAIAEGIYFYLRSGSGALTPATAPSFYRFAFTPGLIASNTLQYFDRTATFALVVALAWMLITRSAVPLTWRSRRVLIFAALWWAGTLAITVLLPVRSSLYACLPSVAAALVVAVLLTESFALVPIRSAHRAVAAGLLLPFILSPIYYSRARRLRLEAELSTATLAALQRVASEVGHGASVRLFDNRAERPSLANPFGALIQQAADLMVHPPISVWIEPPPDDAVVAGLKRPSKIDVDLSLQNGQIVPGRAATVLDR